MPEAAAEPQEEGSAATIFSPWWKMGSTLSSVLGSAVESTDVAQRPAFEDHLFQFEASSKQIEETRRFVTSQERSGQDVLKYLVHGQRQAATAAEQTYDS